MMKMDFKKALEKLKKLEIKPYDLVAPSFLVAALSGDVIATATKYGTMIEGTWKRVEPEAYEYVKRIELGWLTDHFLTRFGPVYGSLAAAGLYASVYAGFSILAYKLMDIGLKIDDGDEKLKKDLNLLKKIPSHAMLFYFASHHIRGLLYWFSLG